MTRSATANDFEYALSWTPLKTTYEVLQKTFTLDKLEVHFLDLGLNLRLCFSCSRQFCIEDLQPARGPVEWGGRGPWIGGPGPGPVDPWARGPVGPSPPVGPWTRGKPPRILHLDGAGVPPPLQGASSVSVRLVSTKTSIYELPLGGDLSWLPKDRFHPGTMS
eukprot:1716644-Amphidinium_carterae.1